MDAPFLFGGNMGKGHVTPHFMLGNTQWRFQDSARHGLPTGQRHVVQGQSFSRIPAQSPRGQKLLDRRDPSPTAYFPPTAVDPSVVTRGVIPYYDPAEAALFVARFGSGDAGSSRKAPFPQLVPPVLKRVAPLVGGDVVWGRISWTGHLCRLFRYCCAW